MPCTGEFVTRSPWPPKICKFYCCYWNDSVFWNFGTSGLPAGILADYSVNFASQNTPIVLKESFWSKVKKRFEGTPKILLLNWCIWDRSKVRIFMGFKLLKKLLWDILVSQSPYQSILVTSSALWPNTDCCAQNKIGMTRKYSTHQRRLVQSASAIYLAFGLYFISMASSK